jgi:arsenate-mycothiol transferase
MTPTPSVLFVCKKNGGKSQLAAAIARKLSANRLTILSAGTAPGTSLNHEAVDALEEIGASVEGEYPKPLTEEVMRTVDRVVVLGREASVPNVDGVRVEVWDTDEPAERGIGGMQRMRLIRDDIKTRVEALVAEAAPAPS